MKHFFYLCALLIVLFFAVSCANIQVSREVQSGRSALKLNQPKVALTHFEAAAAQDPNYTTRFTLLNTGIWTYVGRAYYAIGEKEKALASLKRAKESSSDDYVGRIYLGLVMAQTGNAREGKADLEAGLKGLAAWLESLPSTGEMGELWDPGHRIADGISNLLKMVQVERPDWQGIATNVEWLGKALEEEIENVKDDKEKQKGDGGGGD
jgi:tetratricopeptide (TPR) repeat protein